MTSEANLQRPRAEGADDLNTGKNNIDKFSTGGEQFTLKVHFQSHQTHSDGWL